MMVIKVILTFALSAFFLLGSPLRAPRAAHMFFFQNASLKDSLRYNYYGSSGDNNREKSKQQFLNLSINVALMVLSTAAIILIALASK